MSRAGSTPPVRLFLEALRLDRWPPDEVERRARAALELGVGGFVLFGGRAAEVAALVDRLRREAGRPLWIAADLERGAGQQFRGAPQLPPPAALAAHPDPEGAARAAGSATGRDARALGVNWVLAPVLDLDVEPRNPIVDTRSFGADARRVARLGRAWIEACQAEGVAACAKHFPGHGRTRGDSHLELPSVDAAREALEEDLLPFREACPVAAGVMTAHVAYPSLGERGPATLSRALLGDLLRDELGFRGLVATDAMIMAGFRDGDGRAGEGGDAAGGDAVDGTPAEARLAARAVAAGCDVLLYPEDLAAAARGLAAAVEADPALAARVREATGRAEALLARFAGTGRPWPRAGGDARAAGGAASGAHVELATACIRAVGGPDPRGWRRDASTEVTAVSDDPPDAAGGEAFGAELAAELGRRGWSVAPPPARDDGSGGREPARQRIVAVRATPRGWKGRAGLSAEAAAAIRRAADGAPRSLVALFGHPRRLRELGMAGICAWSPESLMQRAAARWLDARVGDGGGAGDGGG